MFQNLFLLKDHLFHTYDKSFTYLYFLLNIIYNSLNCKLFIWLENLCYPVLAVRTIYFTMHPVLSSKLV